MNEVRPNPDALLARVRNRTASPDAAGSRSFSEPAPASARPSRCSRRPGGCSATGPGSVRLHRVHGRSKRTRCWKTRGVPSRWWNTGREVAGVRPRRGLARKPVDPPGRRAGAPNAPGRSTQRAGRTSALLDAGITMFTTVNIQHIESRTILCRRSRTSSCGRPCGRAARGGGRRELVDCRPTSCCSG